MRPHLAKIHAAPFPRHHATTLRIKPILETWETRHIQVKGILCIQASIEKEKNYLSTCKFLSVNVPVWGKLQLDFCKFTKKLLALHRFHSPIQVHIYHNSVGKLSTGEHAYYPSPWKVEVEDHFTLGVRIHLRNITRHYFRRMKKKGNKRERKMRQGV